MVVESEKSACGYCRQRASEVKRLYLGKRIDQDGKLHEGCICSDCIEMFVLELAHSHPAELAAIVARARNEPPGERPPGA